MNFPDLSHLIKTEIASEFAKGFSSSQSESFEPTKTKTDFQKELEKQVPETKPVENKVDTNTKKEIEKKPEVTEKPVTPPVEKDTTVSPGKETTPIPKPNSSSFDSIIKEMGEKYNVSVPLIYSVIRTESDFNPNAVSHSGAQGLMQLMPKTAEYLGVKDAMDPRQNIEGGVKYLSQMIKRYNGNLTYALAAYNAGPGNVDKYGGVPPFTETQNYVKKILG